VWQERQADTPMVNRFIKELRRREVFRTAGLYVGICWILIEAAYVLLPTFGAEEWLLRAMVIVAVAGFPVTVVLAWFFDLSDRGIQRQADPTDTVVPALGGRKTDFIVISVLSIAFIFSVYINLAGGPQVLPKLEPVSVLIADFENQTGEPVFDGLLELALTVGIEGAPHISSYQRIDARLSTGQLQPGSVNLDAPVARLIAVREGIDVVLAGSISPDGAGYRLLLSGLDPESGETLFDVSSDADSKDAVLNALGEISADLREELGDNTAGKGKQAIAEIFTAASIEAAQAYSRGQQLAYEGNHDGAVKLYRQAISIDADFGRAHAGIALSSSGLGPAEDSEAHWETALSMMDSMTERERLRTRGTYHLSVTENYNSAIENFRSLVEKYPADAAGHNNLASLYFLTLDFENARIEGERILDIYPNNVLYRSNYALYAMYAGDLETATREARKVVTTDPGFYRGYLPLAIAAMNSGDFAAARDAYASMALTGARGKSLANAGIADLELYSGNFVHAQQIIEAGIDEDKAAGNSQAAATKLIILAETLLHLAKNEEALAALATGLEIDRGIVRTVPAAMIYLHAGKTDAATAIADSLSQKVRPQHRAYGLMIEALVDLESGRNMDAVDKLRAATEIADLWLVRFHTGRAYLAAGYPVEALADFELAARRHGEAAAIFLDDTPTYRFLATLPFWLDRVQNELGTSGRVDIRDPDETAELLQD